MGGTQFESRASGRYLGLSVVVIVCLALYWATAYPTITWWGAGEYSLAALTLGVATPPGSLLLTILGWLFSRLPLGLTPGHQLNLLVGVFATITAGMMYIIASRLLRAGGQHPASHRPKAIGGGALGLVFGTLTFAFGTTVWHQAVRFTPYILTTVFTALILYAMLRWWENAHRPDSVRWLLLIGLLLGLDFSVHRTNLLLVLPLFFWILLRSPKTLIQRKAWLSGLAGVIIGFAFHLLIIPMAAAAPLLNAGDPSTLGRFYDYVSLKQYGGGWLVTFYPRNGPFWTTQVMDLIRAFGANFLWIGERVGVFGILPALFGVIGLGSLYRRNRRLAIALVVLLVTHAAVTVLYFNIPENFFRSLHRHYLPVFTVFGILIACGMGAMMRIFWTDRSGQRRGVLRFLSVLLIAVPLAQVVHNWSTSNASNRYFAADWGANLLTGLPQNAILFTNGDNDTWPPMFVQAAHGLRRDVDIVNLPLLNTPWYVRQIIARDTEFPLTLTPEQISQLRFQACTDTTILLPVHGAAADLGLPSTLALPDSIPLEITPTVGDQYVRPQDLLLKRIAFDNAWRRPICFAVTVSPTNVRWFDPYLRMDGTFYRMVPQADAPLNTDLLRTNLEQYSYRGYDDANVYIEDYSRTIAQNYYQLFLSLAHTESVQGDADACHETIRSMFEHLPASHVGPGEETQQAAESVCEPQDSTDAQINVE